MNIIDKLTIGFILIIVLPTILFFGIRDCWRIHQEQKMEEQKMAIAIQQLRNEGYSEINALIRGYHIYIDYNGAEMLARKRADEMFGINNYVFSSTNVDDKVFWKAVKKEVR